MKAGGSQREDDQPDEKEAPATEAVADPATGHEQRREGDVVGSQHPGERGAGGAGEGRLDIGEGDADDGDVEVDEKARGGGDGKHAPAMVTHPGSLDH